MSDEMARTMTMTTMMMMIMMMTMTRSGVARVCRGQGGACP
jgi:hypothetical protein